MSTKVNNEKQKINPIRMQSNYEYEEKNSWSYAHILNVAFLPS